MRACLIWLALVISLAPLSSHAAGRNNLFVTQIVIHPLDPRIVYAVTTYSIGLLKSTDSGQHWSLINNGIKSYSLYHFAVHPRDLNTIYLGAGGGGLYKSVDGGNHWVERNDGFQDTDIGQMFLHPNDPDKIYVVSATGVYKSPDGGKSWEAWNQGDTFTTSQEFQNILIIPGKPGPGGAKAPDKFFLASKHGLYTRAEDDPLWRLASKELEEKMVSALAVDPGGKRIYAAIFRNSQTLKGGGLFASDDFGVHWKEVGKGIERDWIRVIRFDPGNPKRLYLATSFRGVLVSLDGGQTWKESNKGLDATDLRALVLDPSNPNILYAGAHGEGIFKSTDGAATWTHLDNIPMLEGKAIIAQLTTPDPNRKKPDLSPPAAFAKCNKCHGWTDPFLNTVNGFWLVTPNRRDWSLTVKRMRRGAGLTDNEEEIITNFLNAYSGAYGNAP